MTVQDSMKTGFMSSVVHVMMLQCTHRGAAASTAGFVINRLRFSLLRQKEDEDVISQISDADLKHILTDI